MADSSDAIDNQSAESPRLLTRRRLLFLGAAGGGTLALALIARRVEILDILPNDPRQAPPQPGRSWGMIIDLSRCDGCGLCTIACGKAHFVPEGQEWIKVFKVKDEGGSEYFLPRPCMHCDNAPCVNVCPVGATYRREDGVILVDHTRCIGCRYCMAACPYSARYFNWGEPAHTPDELAHSYSPEAPWPHRRGVVEKCVFCAHRSQEGKLPACVEGCPMHAIYFGDINEDVVTNNAGESLLLSRDLKERAAFRFKEELGTKPRVFYLPPRKVV